MILINHELKTPLTVMLSFLELLQETKLSEEQVKYISRIAGGASRLQGLINDSLELVSAETGQLPIKVTGINLKKLIADVRKDFETRLTDKSMDLIVALDAEDVRADAKALRSVLTRLLDNAIKFGHEKTTIEFSSRETLAKTVELSLINEGKGLKADVLARILQPFSLNEDIMNHTKGAGLGLSVVQALLRRLGSQLEVEAPKGKFSATFSLPSG